MFNSCGVDMNNVLKGIDSMNLELDSLHALLKAKLRACRKLKAAWLEFKELKVPEVLAMPFDVQVSESQVASTLVSEPILKSQVVFNRNGHKRAKKRLLTLQEKIKIKKEFLRLNGEITEDAAVIIHKGMLVNKKSQDVSIFQVTGCIVNLHKKVREGLLEVRDRESYDRALMSRRSVKDLVRMGYFKQQPEFIAGFPEG